MTNPRVIVISADYPLDSDAYLRLKMANEEMRAARQSPRFPSLDLYAIQKSVNKNLQKLQLFLEGRYGILLDLINFVNNNRRFPNIGLNNASRYHHLGNTFTLNGVYLYQYLRKKGYDPLVFQNYSLANLLESLKLKPLAVCISSTFIYLDDIKEMAAQIKALDPTIPVIVGGILVKKILNAGPKLAPQTLKWLSTFYGKVDAFVVETHGEQSLVRLLESLNNGVDPAKVPNLALFDGKGRIFFTPRQAESFHIDSSAIDWGKIPLKYLRRTLSVITSVGCYYRCRFCTYHRLFPKVHYKSLNVLREELRRIQALGFVRHVRFADDNFTAGRERLKAVLKMMIEEKFDFTWSSFARASSLTPDVVNLMKGSGCDLLFMGIESGSQIILNNMNKKLNTRQAFDAIRILKACGIDSLGSFIIGYPGESVETFYQTIDLINRSGLNYYQPYLFYNSKDLLVHEEREKFGLMGLGHAWRHKTMDSVKASHLMSQTVRMIEHGFSEGKVDTWETYKTLRGEGYSRKDIFELFRLKRDLQVALEASGAERPFSQKVECILNKLEARST